MLIQVLKSKLKKVKVTGASVDYEGSLTLDPDLMDAARLWAYERVEVNAVNGKDRLVTYVIPGERGTGQVEMNGGMANFFKPGDEVHVNCFTLMKFKEYAREYNPFGYRRPKDRDGLPFMPCVVTTDENNKIIV